MLQADAVRSGARELSPDVAALLDRQYTGHPANVQYDAVIISNPTMLHLETIRQTKHLSRCFFVEKPVFASGDVSLDKLELPKENRYYVAAPLRYTGVLQEIAKIVKSTRIYAARAISSSYLPEWRRGIDYRKVYSARKEMGGGVAVDLIHEWDYLISLFGFPEYVEAMQGKFSDLEIDSEDLAVYLGRYKTLLVELHLDYFGRPARREIELFTKEGVITGDILQGTICFSRGPASIIFGEEENDKYLREMEYFFL